MKVALLVAPLLALLMGVGGTAVLTQQHAESEHQVVTVEGTVVQVEYNPHFNISAEFKLQVTSGGNTTVYEVELGPPWYWAENGSVPTIRVGDKVKVTGELEGDHIEAWILWVNDGNAVIINGEGKPEWTGGPEHPGESDEDHGHEGEHNETED